MRTSALEAKQLWKLRGGRAVIARLVKRYTTRVYELRTDNFYSFKSIQAESRPLIGYNLEYREVPQHDSLPWDPEIAPDHETDSDRFRQGARRYAVVMDGIGIELCWAVSDCDYHDCRDGFTMRLGAKDIYLFDYRGIQKNRPAAFSRFRLWSQFTRAILDFENLRCGGGAQFYSLVATGNLVSNVFHQRKLNANLEGVLRTRVIFGRPVPLLTSDTPSIFIPNRH